MLMPALRVVKTTEHMIRIEKLPNNLNDLSNWEYEPPNQDINIEEEKEIQAFLNNLREISKTEDDLSITTVQKAEDIWILILQEFGLSENMPVISNNEEGEILFSFFKNQEYLGIRILDDSIEVFYDTFGSDPGQLVETYFVDDVIVLDIVKDFFTTLFTSQ